MTFRAALALASMLLLAACGDGNTWHATNITGAMPPLEFRMTRARDGAEVDADAYRDKIVILYFGYTHCPDICPTTLANLADVLGQLGPLRAQVRVLFVTVDPNRDSLSILDAYTKAFAPEIDGLRGSDDALAALARRYRVAFGVTPAQDGRPYTVMHSDAVFFFDKTGRARLVTTSTADTAAIAADVKRLISS
jgi:protein SCO1/2